MKFVQPPYDLIMARSAGVRGGAWTKSAESDAWVRHCNSQLTKTVSDRHLVEMKVVKG